MNLSNKNFIHKQQIVCEAFANCHTKESLYQEIMAWGKKLPSFEPCWKIPSALVTGCQSIMYLHSSLIEGKIHFFAESDALISKGLAALLIAVYSGESPEVILKEPPLFLEKLEIPESLTPSRANGLAALYLKMKQEALKSLLIEKQKTNLSED